MASLPPFHVLSEILLAKDSRASMKLITPFLSSLPLLPLPVISPPRWPLLLHFSLLLPHRATAPLHAHGLAAIAGGGNAAAQHVGDESLDGVDMLGHGVALGRVLIQAGVRLDVARADGRGVVARRNLAIGIDMAADDDRGGRVARAGEAGGDVVLLHFASVVSGTIAAEQ